LDAPASVLLSSGRELITAVGTVSSALFSVMPDWLSATASALASSLSSSAVATGRAEMASLIFPTAFENYRVKHQHISQSTKARTT
jgi:hypothetical protein